MKKTSFLRVICLLLSCIFFFSSLSFGVSASIFSEGLPSVERAQSVYFANLDTGRVIIRKDTEKKIAPASTVKIMTGLLAAEAFENKRDTLIMISAEMLSDTVGARVGLKVGEVISAEDLIYAAICGGYNDAAYALAVAVSGSTEKFVELMNQRAKKLEARDTHYTNPTGWDDPKMYTTLTDTVLIARAAIENDFYMTVSSAVSKKITVRNTDTEITVNNRNALISSHYAQGYANKYAKGLIAGMTDMGGHSVVTKAVIGEASYLCIVMGAEQEEQNIYSFAIADNLIHYARRSLGFVKVASKGDLICKIPTESSMLPANSADGSFSVSAVLNEDVMAYMPLSVDPNTVTYKYYLYSDTLKAPLDAGQRVGSVDFYYNGEIIATAPLCVSEDIPANEFLLFVEDVRNIITSRVFIVSLISFILLSGVYFLFLDRKINRKKSKTISYKNF